MFSFKRSSLPSEFLGHSGRTRRLGFESLENRELLATTEVLKDIDMPTGSYPQAFTKAGSITFFVATTNDAGQELWKTDGTADGTVRVKDIEEGVAGSYPKNLKVLGGTLYFTAVTTNAGRELWKSDGTEEGTVLVADLVAGTVGSNPAELFVYKSKLYFHAFTSSAGRELWSTTGTAATTVMLKDINSGNGAGLTNGSAFTNLNGTLYFIANNGSQGRELWKSNGSSAGTTLVKDIFPGSNGSGAKFLTNVNGTLFFTANNGSSGYELWKSSGTAATTSQVKDIRTGNLGSIERFASKNLTNVNGTLYFVANNGSTGNELWKSNGTTAGTVLVKDIRSGSASAFYPGTSSIPSQATRSLTNLNGILYFYANNGSTGNELWRSNGLSSGTILVKDINPGSYGSLDESGPNFTNVNGVLYFAAFTSSAGTELWQSNGTSVGTSQVTDLAITVLGSYPHSLANVNGLLYFAANDQLIGSELWIHSP